MVAIRLPRSKCDCPGNPGLGPIYGTTDEFVWQDNWKRLETIYGKIKVNDANAARVGFLNLFFAAWDNFIVQEFAP